MALRAAALIPYLFLGLSVLFFVLAGRSGENGIARRTRTRIAWIFLAVGIVLLLLRRVP